MLHRTLDQYYYHMLRSTKKRDQDQVVSRWAKKHLFGHFPRDLRRRLRFDEYPPHNILMVDQLWIWKFQKEGIDYVVSCFPNSKGVNTSKDDTLRDLVLDPSQDIAPIHSSLDLVYRIIGTCSNVFDRCQDTKELRFLQMFEESIGSAVRPHNMSRETLLICPRRATTKANCSRNSKNGCNDLPT